MPPARVSVLAFAALLALHVHAQAPADALPVPLASADPQHALTIIDDRTWQGDALRTSAGEQRRLDLLPFVHDAARGPVTLVVDYAATRAQGSSGKALIDVGVECPQAREPCAIPLAGSVITIRGAFMGQGVAVIDGRSLPVWIARETHAYTFRDATPVEIWLSPGERSDLEPQAIRARLVYGEIDRTPLPGEATRLGLWLKIAAVTAVLLGLGVWWLRRP
jgi:hypothetical protein